MGTALVAWFAINFRVQKDLSLQSPKRLKLLTFVVAIFTFVILFLLVAAIAGWLVRIPNSTFPDTVIFIFCGVTTFIFGKQIGFIPPVPKYYSEYYSDRDK